MCNKYAHRTPHSTPHTIIHCLQFSPILVSPIESTWSKWKDRHWIKQWKSFITRNWQNESAVRWRLFFCIVSSYPLHYLFSHCLFGHCHFTFVQKLKPYSARAEDVVERWTNDKKCNNVCNCNWMNGSMMKQSS